MRLFPRRLRHGEEATLVEHLGELRSRIFICLITIVAAFVVTYIFHGRILTWLNRPLPANAGKPLTFSPIEPFSTSILVSLWAALLLALPVVLWQLWAFLAPALQEHRQRSVVMMVAFATLLGGAGIAFGYFVVLPAAIKFLLNFNQSQFNIEVRASEYYSFVTLTLLAMGIVFQVPMGILAATKLGITTPEKLRHNRRYAYLILAVIAMLLPGTDPITMLIELLPLIILYEISIVLARVFGRPVGSVDAAAGEAS
jgi:sec-independent protein translocase protein TatC